MRSSTIVFPRFCLLLSFWTRFFRSPRDDDSSVTQKNKNNNVSVHATPHAVSSRLCLHGRQANDRVGSDGVRCRSDRNVTTTHRRRTTNDEQTTTQTVHQFGPSVLTHPINISSFRNTLFSHYMFTHHTRIPIHRLLTKYSLHIGIWSN